MFSRRRSVSPEYDNNSPRRTSTSASRANGGMFHRNHEDSSITAARQRVIQAEQSERDADRALVAARQSVKNARDQVKALELEAKEE